MSGRVLIYGGRGALGSVVLDHFKSKGWWTLNVDLFANDNANENVLVDKNQPKLELQATKIVGDCEAALSGHRLDAVLCVAGGWAGGNAAAPEFVKNCELMWEQSVASSIVAANLAAKFLNSGGLVQFTGAQPALSGTPTMIGYGLAKAAVHQLVQSLAQPDSGLPSNSTVLALLPVTLDTPMNRKWMPKADHTTWTPLEWVAQRLFGWVSEGQSRPKSGSLLRVVTEHSQTELLSV